MPENVDNAELAELVESAVTEAPAGATAPAPEKTEEAPVAAEAEASESSAEPTVTFGDLGLPEGIVRKLAQNGVTTPFPIQAATIPDALAGKDILGRGRTGSGKTLSFGLPTLSALAGGRTEKNEAPRRHPHPDP
ncbi:DEAD/DEAH box helicase [Streptomyces sp. Termitarium-T10T-6]|nr:DEAD/DEAH box helicase [Streptomyces sp. Termitarium-T10T-6]